VYDVKTVFPFQTFFDFWQHLLYPRATNAYLYKKQDERKKQRNNVIQLFPEK